MNFYATLKKQNVLGRPEVSQKADGRAGSGVEVDGLRLGVEPHCTGLRVQWGKSSWIFCSSLHGLEESGNSQSK